VETEFKCNSLKSHLNISDVWQQHQSVAVGEQLSGFEAFIIDKYTIKICQKQLLAVRFEDRGSLLCGSVKSNLLNLSTIKTYKIFILRLDKITSSSCNKHDTKETTEKKNDLSRFKLFKSKV
jgi:hypothetical protein